MSTAPTDLDALDGRAAAQTGLACATKDVHVVLVLAGGAVQVDVVAQAAPQAAAPIVQPLRQGLADAAVEPCELV